MVSISTYEGNDGKTNVREENKYPSRVWLDFPQKQSTKVSGIVLESAYLQRETKYGEAIYVFGHDAETGELVAMTFGVAVGTHGKRGTVWSRSGVETLLDTEYAEGDPRDQIAIANPTIKPAFINKTIWVGKTQVAGKSWNAFECDFMSGEPKYDSSYRGIDEVDADEPEDVPEASVDMSDEANVYIIGALEEGKDALTISKEVEEKFSNFTSNAAVKRVMEVKGSLE